MKKKGAAYFTLNDEEKCGINIKSVMWRGNESNKHHKLDVLCEMAGVFIYLTAV